MDHTSEGLSTTHLRSLVKRYRAQNVYAGPRTTLSPVSRIGSLAAASEELLGGLRQLKAARAVEVTTYAEALRRHPQLRPDRSAAEATLTAEIRASIARNLRFDPLEWPAYRCFLVT